MYYISWSLFMVRLLLQMRAMSLSVFYCQRIIWWNSYFVTNTDRTIYWLSFVICVSDKNSVIGFYLGVLLLTLFFILVALVVIKSVWCETRMCSVFLIVFPLRRCRDDTLLRFIIWQTAEYSPEADISVRPAPSQRPESEALRGSRDSARPADQLCP